MKLRQLHGAALGVAIAALIIISGATAFAAVQYGPALIHKLTRTTNNRGRAEYTAPDFVQCRRTPYDVHLDRFEVNKDAPSLSDDEVRNILQAKCELNWVDGFVGKNWPTYGTHKTWQGGDDIFYTRPDMLGTVESISDSGLTISFGNGSSHSYGTLPHKKLAAYADGNPVQLARIKKGDTVFAIVRVSEKYSTHHGDFQSSTQPHMLGLVATIKLTWPLDYYGKMQSYLTEIPECLGNPNEYCPSTGGIDVYPRKGGEGAANPFFVQKQDAVPREISGTVTAFGNRSLTLKSRTGTTYTVTLGENGFSDYNSTYAPAYIEEGTDAALRVGSNVNVLYSQPENADAKTITVDQVVSVMLQLEDSSLKSPSGKQY